MYICGVACVWFGMYGTWYMGGGIWCMVCGMRCMVYGVDVLCEHVGGVQGIWEDTKDREC